MTDTPLDHAYAKMEADADDGAARLGFYERLADSELFLLLEAEQDCEEITPRLFPLEAGPFVLVFDREERLADFAAGPAPYAGLSGRIVAQMLAGKGIGLGVNLGVAPSSILIPDAAVDWLANMLEQGPDEVEALPEELSAPSGLPEVLITNLDAKLATAQGLADMAYLAGVTYQGGVRSHMLAYIDVVPGAEAALARATGEALAFSGIEAGALDVAFFRATDPMAARLARVGLRFDLPKAEAASARRAPGSDPDKPPRLR